MGWREVVSLIVDAALGRLDHVAPIGGPPAIPYAARVAAVSASDGVSVDPTADSFVVRDADGQIRAVSLRTLVLTAPSVPQGGNGQLDIDLERGPGTGPDAGRDHLYGGIQIKAHQLNSVGQGWYIVAIGQSFQTLFDWQFIGTGPAEDYLGWRQQFPIRAQTVMIGTGALQYTDLLSGADWQVDGSNGGAGSYMAFFGTGGAVLHMLGDGKWAFSTKAPIATPTRAGQLTDATGGTPSGTNTLVTTGTASVDNNFATLLAKYNALEAAISARGITT